MGVRPDRLPVELDADPLCVEALRVGNTPHRHEHHIRLYLAVLPPELVVHRVVLHPADLCAQPEQDPVLGHPLLRQPGDLDVHHGQDMVHQLQHRHLTAQTVQEIGELHADHTAADHGDRGGHLIQVQGLGAGQQVVFPLQREEGGHEYAGAGGDDDVGPGDAPAVHRQGMGIGKRGHSLHHRYLIAPEQTLDAVDQGFDHGFLSGLQGGHIHRDLVRLHARHREAGGILHLVVHVGGLNQRLGWDAAHVQAGASETGPLDDAGFFPALGRLDRRLIAAGAGTDHDHVVVVSGRLRRGRGRGLGGGGAVEDGIGVLPRSADHGDGGEHLGESPLLQHELEDGAVRCGLYGHGGLVGVDLKEHLALLYRFTHPPVPLDQLALVHIEAQLGHDDDLCHDAPPLTSESG